MQYRRFRAVIVRRSFQLKKQIWKSTCAKMRALMVGQGEDDGSQKVIEV